MPPTHVSSSCRASKTTRCSPDRVLQRCMKATFDTACRRANSDSQQTTGVPSSPPACSSPARGLPPRAPLKRYPTPFSDACPAPAQVAPALRRAAGPLGGGALAECDGRESEPAFARPKPVARLKGHARPVQRAHSAPKNRKVPKVPPGPHLVLLCSPFPHGPFLELGKEGKPMRQTK